jgi:hypothetical protein
MTLWDENPGFLTRLAWLLASGRVHKPRDSRRAPRESVRG